MSQIKNNFSKFSIFAERSPAARRRLGQVRRRRWKIQNSWDVRRE